MNTSELVQRFIRDDPSAAELIRTDGKGNGVVALEFMRRLNVWFASQKDGHSFADCMRLNLKLNDQARERGLDPDDCFITIPRATA